MDAEEFFAVFVDEHEFDLDGPAALDGLELKLHANEQSGMDQRKLRAADGIEHADKGGLAAIDVAGVVAKFGNGNAHRCGRIPRWGCWGGPDDSTRRWSRESLNEVGRRQAVALGNQPRKFPNGGELARAAFGVRRAVRPPLVVNANRGGGAVIQLDDFRTHDVPKWAVFLYNMVVRNYCGVLSDVGWGELRHPPGHPGPPSSVPKSSP